MAPRRGSSTTGHFSIYSDLRPLDQQAIVITGASSGIGPATARMAAKAGAGVLLVARNGVATMAGGSAGSGTGMGQSTCTGQVMTCGAKDRPLRTMTTLPYPDPTDLTQRQAQPAIFLAHRPEQRVSVLIEA
jgi:hypothetical protein